MRFELALFALITVVGCDDAESFLSGEGLEEAFGVTPAPREPAWVIAWWLPGEGVDFQCDVESTETLDASPDNLGEIVVWAPDIEEPPFWNETWVVLEGYDYDEEALVEWAVGLPVLVDLERYETPSWEEGRITDPLAFERGVWGVANRARLFTIGKPEAVDLVFPLLLDAEDVLGYQGSTWVGIFHEAVSLRGIQLAIYPEPLEGREMSAIWTEWASEAHLAVWSGVTPEESGAYGDCPP